MVTARRRISGGPLTAALVVASTTALALGAGVPPASAATSKPPVQVGLFGSQDPTYDGVFRQSLALLAYSAAGATPPTEAVTWLVGQQCADGGFQSFRASLATPCQKSDPATFSGEDTNSTGIAAAALRAVGRAAAADRAVAWTLAAQKADGGFPYYVGGDSDANSTATVLLGTNSAGRTPASVARAGVSAATFLASLQLGCPGAATDDDGGFAFQDYGSGLVDNDAASVQATLALSGASLPVPAGPVSSDVPRATCPPSGGPTLSPAQLGAGHLARLLDTFHGAVPQFDYNAGSRVPGSVSLGDTAWAALSLAAVGVGRAQLDAALGVIATASSPAASTGTAATTSADQPGLLALAALATHAGGGSAASVRAYVARIGATMRVAPAVTSPTPSGSPSTSGSTGSSGSSDPLATSGPTPLTPVLGALGGLLVLLGAGALASTRRRGAHA